MFDKKGFMAFVGNNSGASYANGLDNIEKVYGVDIDAEISQDNCTNLLSRIDADKKQPPAMIATIAKTGIPTLKSMWSTATWMLQKAKSIALSLGLNSNLKKIPPISCMRIQQLCVQPICCKAICTS